MQNIEGLIPAIVQDYYSGRVLMLAYVNQESYVYMLKNNETCFWSRSRQELWHKGATSGNVQKIRSMAFDCDNDTLLIQVEQMGSGACHTGSYSCFGQHDAAQYSIINEISSQIIDRKANPKEKSYTNYLLDAGVDKICKKIGEEATEIIISVKNEDRADFISEVSDFVYHLLVLMNTQGVTPHDIREQLVQRHHVKDNLKTKNEKGAF